MFSSVAGKECFLSDDIDLLEIMTFHLLTNVQHLCYQQCIRFYTQFEWEKREQVVGFHSMYCNVLFYIFMTLTKLEVEKGKHTDGSILLVSYFFGSIFSTKPLASRFCYQQAVSLSEGNKIENVFVFTSYLVSPENNVLQHFYFWLK